LVEKGKNINKTIAVKKVLVAPLDWGLGHVTRCIPIIKMLLNEGFEVFIGSENPGTLLLQNEFPNIKIIPLQGYNITYSKIKQFFLWKMAIQLPQIVRAIQREHSWLEKIIRDYKIDIVISDNRFGLYNSKVHCVFITHQLKIKTGNNFIEKIVQKINYRYINKFNECWVMDEGGTNNFAGDLSHPKLLPKVPVKYIGLQSRFTKYVTEKKYDLLIVLSGPEPQRTIFENILLHQIQDIKLNIVLVRGLPVSKNLLEINGIKIYNHLSAKDLNALMLASKTIIARSGYTTIMDIAALQQKAIFVPTPGQTEQEYLANYLSQKKYFITEMQDGFDLQRAMPKLENAELVLYPITENTILQDAIIALR
jgi:uncharacterized protein (TIGR00661 family)